MAPPASSTPPRSATGTPLPAGGEFRLNSFTANDQDSAAVAALAGGGFVTTWSSLDQDGSGWGIYGQRHDAAGGRLGSEFRINDVTEGHQYGSAVAGLRDGGFVVVWSAEEATESDYDAHGRVYDAQGVATGASFRLNSATEANQSRVAVAALTDGGFVTAWSSLLQDGSGWGVYGQRHDAAGGRVGGEFRINSTVAGDQWYPSLAALANGGFVAVWTSDGEDGSGEGVFGQRYDAGGAAAGAAFAVNSHSAGDQLMGSVAGLADGGFVTVWKSLGQDGFAWSIHGQRYAADGAPQGQEFRVQGFAVDQQIYQSVTALADGGFLVSWCAADAGLNRDLFAQRYDAAGAADGLPFQLNQSTAGLQFQYFEAQAVAQLTDGAVVAVWSGDPAVAGNESYGRLFSLDQAFGPAFSGVAAFGTATAPLSWTDSDRHPRTIADVNGDGFADIIGFHDHFTFVAQGLGDGRFAQPQAAINGFGTSTDAGGWSSATLYARQMGDVNGDGRADIIGFGSDGVFVALAAADASFGAAMPALGSFGASAAAGDWSNDRVHPRLTGDVNGDGRCDIVAFGRDGVLVALGQADGHFAAPVAAIASFGSSAAGGGWSSQHAYARQLGDVNGDGRADIISFGAVATYVALGQADGRFAPATVATAHFSHASGWENNAVSPRFVADLDADGRDDLIGFGSAGVQAAFAQPDGSFGDLMLLTDQFGPSPAAGGWTGEALYPRLIEDLDGDGRSDIIGFAPGGVQVALNQTDLLIA